MLFHLSILTALLAIICITTAMPFDLGQPVQVYNPCVTIGSTDFQLDIPTSIPSHGRDIEKHTLANGQSIFSSWDTEHGYIIEAYGAGHVVIKNRGTNAWLKNGFMLFLDDSNVGTPYYWIDKNGGCTLDYDYSRVSGGYAYGFERFGG